MLCCLFFLRATFPLDEIKTLVSKWVQNRYQVDFSVDMVSFSGLAGLSMQGIYIVQSPTEEQKKAMQDYLKALKQENEEKAEREKLEKEEKAKAKKEKKKGKKDKDKKEEEGTATTNTAEEKEAKDTSKEKEVKEDKLERPKMPTPMTISDLQFQLDFWSLLLSQKFNFNTSAKISEGSVYVEVQENAEQELELNLEAKDLSLVALGPVLDLSPMPLLANLNVNAKLAVPKAETTGNFKYDETNGQVTFKLSDLKTKAFSVQNEMAGVLDIPALNIGTLGGQIEFARKRASFVDFKLGDQDFEGFLTGHLDLTPKIENINANAHVHLQLNIDFIKKTPLVSTMATLEKKYFQKEPDGSYLVGFVVKGKLTKIKTQPKIHSPFSREGRQHEKEDVKNNPNPNIKPTTNTLPTTPVISNQKPSLPPPPRANPTVKSNPLPPQPMQQPSKPIQFPSMKNNAEIDAPSIVPDAVEAPQEENPSNQETEENKEDEQKDDQKEDQKEDDENKEDENKGLEGIEIEGL